MLKVGLHGASGRMGQEIADIMKSAPERYALSFTKVSEKDLQDKTRHYTVFPETTTAQVVIDFTIPEASMELLTWCLKQKIALVIGTTGFNPEQLAKITAAAEEIPILMSPNMSLSVNALFKLVETATRYLPQAEVEIIESHHRQKKDAPSGTGLRLGEAVAVARGQKLSEVAVFGRHGVDNLRKPDEIGFAVVRGGDIVGKHTVSFILNGEELNLTSEITNRKSFAEGALVAAEYVIRQPAGFYTMNDVLGL